MENLQQEDFRTWAGTVLAALELQEIGAAESATATKKALVQAVKTVAEYLGNRPATCRKYYVHPAILDAYESGALLQVMAEHSQELADAIADPTSGLRCEEQAVVVLLKQQLIQELQAG
jgi:DNA topoisomerase-1